MGTYSAHETQQVVHTLLDLQMLAALQRDAGTAERAESEADRILGELDRGGEPWRNPRFEVKRGLAHAALRVVAGDADGAVKLARTWLNRAQADGNLQGCDTAAAILEWSRSSIEFVPQAGRVLR